MRSVYRHRAWQVRTRHQVPGADQKSGSFEHALALVQKHSGVSYHFELVLDDGSHRSYDHESKHTVKTDKVFVTKLGQNLSKNGLTPIGASLTHRLYSPNAADIATVLNAIGSQD